MQIITVRGAAPVLDLSEPVIDLRTSPRSGPDNTGGRPTG